MSKHNAERGREMQCSGIATGTRIITIGTGILLLIGTNVLGQNAIKPVVAGFSYWDGTAGVAKVNGAAVEASEGAAGFIEFSLAGYSPASSAVLSVVPDQYDRSSGEDALLMQLAFYGANGLLDAPDITGEFHNRLLAPARFRITSTDYPAMINVTEAFNTALAAGYSHVGFIVDRWSDPIAGIPASGWFRVDANPNGPGDGIIANNFRLEITPEPATLLLVGTIPLLGLKRRPMRRTS